MTYRVEISESAAKIIAKMQVSMARRIKTVIMALADDPRPLGVKKLQGEQAYRLRVGDYRVVYTISDKELVVWVVRVGHRREVYRRR